MKFILGKAEAYSIYSTNSFLILSQVVLRFNTGWPKGWQVPQVADWTGNTVMSDKEVK